MKRNIDKGEALSSCQ